MGSGMASNCSMELLEEISHGTVCDPRERQSQDDMSDSETGQFVLST
jgi:hypothetical protein